LPIATHVPLAPGFEQKNPLRQSPSDAHEAPHATELAQWRWPEQGIALPAMHEPMPLHVLLENALFEQVVPHGVPTGGCSHTPPTPHLPSLPQGGFTGHWPGSACVPGIWLAHVPSGMPVRTIVHRWQVPLHAELQHTPSTQWPVVHWPGVVQALPWYFLAVHVPPLFVVSQ
jgi:hypothetical protein